MKTTAFIIGALALGLAGPVAAKEQVLETVVRRAIARIDGAPAQVQLAQAPQGQGRGGDRGNSPAPKEADRPPPQRLIPLEQAKAAIQRQVPGEMLDASGPTGGERPVYRIRWQARSGQRIDFTVDAKTGAIIGRSGG